MPKPLAIALLLAALVPGCERRRADDAAFKACSPSTPGGCERYIQQVGAEGRHVDRADDIYFGSLRSSPVDLEGYPVLLPKGRHVAEVPEAVRRAMDGVVKAYAARTLNAPVERRVAVAAWARALEVLRDAGRATVHVRFVGAGMTKARESLLLGQVEDALRIDGAPGFRASLLDAPVVLDVGEAAVTVRVRGETESAISCMPEALKRCFGF